jgi:TRAP-type mannitol/chloroaromatic compound transport system permease small subunit
VQALLKLSRFIDAITILLGKGLVWVILAVTLISATNAVIRKAFNYSSNAFLEVQWYLFAAVFMLGAGYVFLKNAHVRIDFIYGRLSAKAQAWIDIFGIVVFLAPFCYLMITLGWPIFARAWVSGEMSQNAGGLIRWPAYGVIPLGFALLLMQAVSELIKRFAFIMGLIDSATSEDQVESDEAKLARELLEETERKQKGASA